MEFNEFLAKIQPVFGGELDAGDLDLLRRAFEFAKKAHAGQKRFSGEEYFIHPASAAIILAGVFPNVPAVAATLLHDVPEDTAVTLEQTRKEFGDEIAALIDGVTKLSKVRLRNSKDNLYVENLRKMFVATSKDIRVILIKLADRVHNMRTIRFVKESKQKRIADETLEIYAPIANRLGIGEWKDELEDLSFEISDPKEYQQTKKMLDQALAGRGGALKILQKEVATILHTEGVKFEEITGRIKRLYSLFKKLQKYEGDISKIYDLLALRVITKSTDLCYAALGALHKHFQPLPGRVKDFIALPKPNGYRSIHTTVFDNNQNVFEIQIRTQQMHDQAERGIASHWQYKEEEAGGLTTRAAKWSEKLSQQWIKDLETVNENAIEPEDFMAELKIDFFRNRIFVLTPKGDVKDLPEGATSIDFAFSVHSDLGFHMQGAKVNGKIAKFNQELQSGDMVEIIKSKKPVKISEDWLKQARTSQARGHIRRYLAEHHIGIINSLKNLIKRGK